jgi:histidine triad (HIT) family protein
MDCLFCKIAAGAIPSDTVYADDKIFAFRDINPQAPVHVLVIPRAHVASIDEVDDGVQEDVSYLLTKIPTIAKAAGLTNGYRVITNCGEDGCQSVKHLHFHILGGKKLSENMG